ncbi:MAG: Glu/Leu/Phe/Val dehydrogenase dimerization domain-containing protein [Candidatus Lokiarchaeota archaeon]
MVLNFEDLFLDKFGPEKILLLKDSITNMKGFLVIDNSIYGVPLGGIRVAEDLTLEEVVKLARSMTLKACTYKIPIGGAKAGLVLDSKSKEKDIIISNFAESIQSFIKEDLFYPEPGLGTNVEDIENIFKISGHPELMPRKVGILRYDIPLKKKYIGYGVIHCLDTLFHEIIGYIKELGIKWNDPPNIILEGFGRTGREIGIQLIKRGYKLNGVSTINGALFNEDGLDIEELLKLKEEYGDEFIFHYKDINSFNLEREKLFNLSSEYSIDFIIPGARPNTINKQNFESIKPKAIVPASLSPYDEEIIEKLEESDVLVFPDFVSNAGDLLALSSRQRARSDTEFKENIVNQIKSKTKEILEENNQKKMSLYYLAKQKAIDDLKKKRKRRVKYYKRLEETFKERKI